MSSKDLDRTTRALILENGSFQGCVKALSHSKLSYVKEAIVLLFICLL